MLARLVEQYGDGYLCIIPFFLLPGSDYSRLLQPLPAAFSSQPQFKMQLPLFSCSPQRTRADFIHPSLCQPSGKTSPALIMSSGKKKTTRAPPAASRLRRQHQDHYLIPSRGQHQPIPLQPLTSSHSAPAPASTCSLGQLQSALNNVHRNKNAKG